MRRNIVRRSILFVSTALALPALIFVGARPASAVTAVSNPHLCETNGSYCLGSQPDTALYRLVTAQSPGRNLALIPLGQRYDNYPTYLIQFTADPASCIGTNNATSIMIQPCSNGTGIVWAQQQVGTSGNLAVYQYINRAASNTYGDIEYLSGVDRAGSYFYTRPSGKTGAYYKFSWKN